VILAIERQKAVTGDEIWLVSMEHPGAEFSTRLAKFSSEREAYLYTEAQACVLAFAREVGRSGLG
jgi:hypothetical protein